MSAADWILAAWVVAALGVVAFTFWPLIRQSRTGPQPLADERRANHGPPPGTPDRRRVDVGRAGRHRRDSAGDDAVTMTGFMRALDAEAVERHARMLAAAEQEDARR